MSGPLRLAALPADVARPRYDRDRLRIGIVHFGAGAFARAHLGLATEIAIEAGGDAGLAWGIAGVSLRDPATRDALAPQDGLYTLVERAADAAGAPRSTLRVIGAWREFLVAPEDPGAVLARIAHDDTRIVSLTVTEKGYLADPQRRLRFEHADIAHDLAHPQSPRTAVGFLAHGLALRRAHGLPGVTLMSLDNLPTNGALLRGLVLEFATRIDPPLAAWIDAQCSFAGSIVDRIVPRTTAADRDEIAVRLHQRDAWPVIAEPYFEWALEDRFVAGRPDWARAGVRLVAGASDVAAWERLKLRMVNGSHSSLAYLGVVAGWSTVDAALRQPALRAHLDALLRDEVEPTLDAARTLPDLDLAKYRAGLLERFANPALAHRTAQIAMDGSQKLPQRLLDTVRDRLAAGAPIARLALGIAGWLHFLRGIDEQGRTYPIDDPQAAALAALHASAESLIDGRARAARLLAYAPVFGDLAGSAELLDAVAPALTALREFGVLPTLQRR
ncbi:MAG: mannitol dehydrogenase family protein [Burkholderiaceae bacterium]